MIEMKEVTFSDNEVITLKDLIGHAIETCQEQYEAEVLAGSIDEDMDRELTEYISTLEDIQEKLQPGMFELAG